MPHVTPRADLLERLKRLQDEAVRLQDGLAQARIDELIVQLQDIGRRLDGGIWHGLSEEAQVKVQAQLENVEAAMTAIVGPRDPNNPMYYSYTGRAWVYALMTLAILITVGAGLVVYFRWQAAIAAPNGTGPPEQTVLGMVMLLGMLGGSIHLITSLATHMGKRDLTRNWIPYYLLLPIQGGALAPIVYLVLRFTTTTLSTGTEQLNLIGIYGVAALTGMYSRQAIEKLADVFDSLFAKVKARPGERTTSASQ